MNIWLEVITQYGALGVLVIILFLIIQGVLVSKKSADNLKTIYELTIKQAKETYEATIKRIIESHTEEVKNITNAFEKQIDSLKEVIAIFKKENGYKKKK